MRIVRAVLPWVLFLGAAILAWKYLLPLFKPEEEEMDVQTSVIRRGDLRDVVPADGTVTPSVLVEVKSKASEVVEKVLVEPGDQVEAGQVLVELGKKDITERIKQAQAGLDSAKAQFALTKRSLSPQQKASGEAAVKSAQIALDNAQAHYDRVAEMHEKGYATDEELGDARTSLEQARHSLTEAQTQLDLDMQGAQPEEIEIAKANLDRLQAELDQLNNELANTTIRAPIAGTVLTRPVEVGTAVASGTSGNTGGTVVATIGDLSSLYVKAQIEELNLGRVVLGTACRVSLDAYPGWVWRGSVRKIYPQGDDGSGQNSGGDFGGGGGGSVRFPVDVSIDLGSGRMDGDEIPADEPGAAGKAERPKLFPKMSAGVEIVLEDHPKVVIVPSQFVKYDDAGKPYAEVIKDEGAEAKAGGKEGAAGQTAGEPSKAGAGPGGSARNGGGGGRPGGLRGGAGGGPGRRGPGGGRLSKEEKAELRKKPREKRPLELGYSDGVRFEVVSGLNEGDTVILERPIKKEN